MNKVLLMVKIQLLGFMGINRLRHSTTPKDKKLAVYLSIGLSLLCITIAGCSAVTGIVFAVIGLADILPSLALVTCALFTLIFTFAKSNGALFRFKDYDMVMSLPVNSKSVIASRLLVVYVQNLMFTVFIMLPIMLVFVIARQAAPSVWLMSLLSILIMPLLPIILGMTLGAVITAVSVRFRYSNLLTIILSAIATMALMLLPMAFRVDKALEIERLKEMLQNALNNTYPPAAFFSNAVVRGSWAGFGLFILLSVTPTFLFILILGKSYMKINSSLASKQSKGNYRITALKPSSPFVALLKKEAKRFFSSPYYFLNTYMGLIMLTVAVLLILMLDPAKVRETMGIPNLFTLVNQFAPLGISMFIVMAPVTAVSLNMEGKNRWLPFSLPLKSITILNAKIALNILVTIPPILISAGVIALRFQADVTETALLILVAMGFAVFTAVFGMAVNVKFPKYDWASEQQATKNSASAGITLLAGLLLWLTSSGIGLFLGKYITWYLLAVTLLLGISAFVLYQGLKKVRLYV